MAGDAKNTPKAFLRCALPDETFLLEAEKSLLVALAPLFPVLLFIAVIYIIWPPPTLFYVLLGALVLLAAASLANYFFSQLIVTDKRLLTATALRLYRLEEIPLEEVSYYGARPGAFTYEIVRKGRLLSKDFPFVLNCDALTRSIKTALSQQAPSEEDAETSPPNENDDLRLFFGKNADAYLKTFKADIDPQAKDNRFRLWIRCPGFTFSSAGAALLFGPATHLLYRKIYLVGLTWLIASPYLIDWAMMRSELGLILALFFVNGYITLQISFFRAKKIIATADKTFPEDAERRAAYIAQKGGVNLPLAAAAAACWWYLIVSAFLAPHTLPC